MKAKSMVIATRRWYLLMGVITALLGCNPTEQERNRMAATAQINPAEWQVLLKTRVVFGHQSVGQNILNGIQFSAAQAGINLPVVESRSTMASKGITHFFIGENGDPLSKIKDFTSVIEGSTVQGADIALMKFCYLDFENDSDAKQIFEQYSMALDRLSQQFPSTTFIAITAPLTVAQTGPKAWIKRLLGRAPSGFADNARRQEFNNLLRARYDHQGRLFDLAKIEAEGADALEYQGGLIEVLNPELTYDDGHLNSQGEQIVATRLIKFLAALSLRN